jgi:segregation and condensation protein B
MEKSFNQPIDEQTRDQLKKALECVLFVATKPLPLEEIARILQVPLDEALMLLNELAVEYERRSGLAIVEVAGGWRMVTRPEYFRKSAHAN